MNIQILFVEQLNLQLPPNLIPRLIGQAIRPLINLDHQQIKVDQWMKGIDLIQLIKLIQIQKVIPPPTLEVTPFWCKVLMKMVSGGCTIILEQLIQFVMPGPLCLY